MSDLISRADAIEAVRKEDCCGWKVDADGYLGLNGWLRHNGFKPYREDGEA